MHTSLNSEEPTNASISRAQITAVVADFYGAVRQDPLLGPIFTAHVNDWAEHLPKMEAFWAKVLRGEAGYRGNPVAAHLRLPDLPETAFPRWLELFSQTLAGHCTAVQRDRWLAATQAMAHGLQAAMQASKAGTYSQQPTANPQLEVL